MLDSQNQQEILKDISKTGKDRNWRGRKIMSVQLSDIFEKLGYKKSLIERIRICGETLQFHRLSDGQLKLYQAYFCKNKLCPMCNWRRSMKYSYQASVVVDKAIEEYPKGRFLFLTLTVKNVEGDKLNETISSLTKSFDRLFKRAKVKKNVLGYIRSTEVTYNEKKETYHPHLHVLLFVNSSYFRDKDNYISQKEWSQLWSQSLKVDYVPMVNIKAVKNTGKGLRGAVLETAKYPMKPIKFEMDNAQVVDDLYKGLYRKRQLGFGGIFKEIKKSLELDSIEDGDLIHTSKDNSDLSEGTKIVAVWNWQKQDYFCKK